MSDGAPVLGALDIARIAAEITRITSFDRSPEATARDVVGRLLQVLQTEPIVKLATLWKIKEDSRTLCAKGRASGTFDPDPSNPIYKEEYVCSYDNSFIREIIECQDFKSGRPFIIENVNEYREDIFFRSSIQYSGISLRVAIVIPIDSHLRERSDNPSYMLIIYLSEEWTKPPQGSYFDSLLQAISNKVSSTLSSQISLKITRITDFVKEMIDASPILDDILERLVEELIPANFYYSHALLIWGRPSMKVPHAKLFSAKNCSRAIPSLSDLDCHSIAHHLLATVHETTTLDAGNIFPSLNHINKIYTSAIATPIANRSPQQHTYAFIVLLDKISPLASKIDPRVAITDYFDWEDKYVMDHIASMMRMLAGLVHAEERRQQLADQLAHELMMPANYIFATAEELSLRYNEESATFPHPRRRRHLSNIAAYAELQIALCDGILVGLRGTDKARSETYRPERLDLVDLAKDVSRLTIPFCDLLRVKNDNIVIRRNLPTIYGDRSAFFQVFLNIMTNAIKYKGALKYDEFKLNVESEYVSLNQLPKAQQEKLRANYMAWFGPANSELFTGLGHIITFEDIGLGVPVGYEEYIFHRYIRAPGIEKHNARGVGLGLAIARRIVEDHYGAIWLDNSVSPTRFVVFLPEKIHNRAYTTEAAWSKLGGP